VNIHLTRQVIRGCCHQILLVYLEKMAELLSHREKLVWETVLVQMVSRLGPGLTKVILTTWCEISSIEQGISNDEGKMMIVKSGESAFQNPSCTTCGNPKRERGTANEAIPKTSLAYASGYQRF
jgi:hypothetical protein